MGKQFSGRLLRDFRDVAPMTQRDLADASGVNQVTITRIENGLERPRPSTVKKLAAALGISPSDLFADVDDKEKAV